MARTRTYLTCALAGALLASGGSPALAARHKAKPKRAYADGVYVGTVTQRAPFSATGHIRFVVFHHTLSALSVQVAELCGKIIWTAVSDAPKALSVRVAPDGRFAYDRTVLGDHVQIKGRLRGSQAVGTFFDVLSSGTLTCTMGAPAAFSARR